MSKPKSAFTLIELLVVIAIIALLVTLSVLALSNARVASRDAKRVSDVKQIQSALELFFDANNRYPTNLEFQSGSLASYASTTGTTTYMSVIPTAPTPADGACSGGNNNYAYRASADGSSYTLNFCVAKKMSDLPDGRLSASSGGIIAYSFSCGDSIDYAGESYPTVQIGTQCWLAKNLDVGTMITGASTNPADNGIIEKYCYNDNSVNCVTYGGLYQWNEMMQYSSTAGAQGICPTSWHIPTDAEQYILENYLTDPGQTCSASRNNVWDCASAGTKLLTGGSSGFNYILAGYRTSAGSFLSRGGYGLLWSSTANGGSAWQRHFSGTPTIHRSGDYPGYAYSVRCLKN